MPRGLELLIAQTILQGFDAQYGRFLEVTSGAQQRFEQADWHAVQQAMKNRIHLYDHHVGLVVEQLRCITNGQSTDAAFLLRVKEHYTRLLPDYPRFEIAESFFNSVYCRLFDHYVDKSSQVNPGTHITVRGSIHGEVSIKKMLKGSRCRTAL